MKFRYLIVNEDYEVTGTNIEKIALQAASSEMVYDTETGEYLGYGDEPRMPIPEETIYAAE